ncbi:MAG TPA: 2'-5' RNA ligase family protein [Rhodanobacter sp.]|nr:2'-5' RNA ligase family protein [Rhodanobacter sp.]
MNHPHASQHDLFGGEHAPAATVHRLFLALLPDERVRALLAQTASTLRTRQGPSSGWVDPLRYHTTLHFLGDYPSPRPDLVAATERVAGLLHGAAVDWTLDRVRSFHGRRPPRVLCGSVLPEPLQALWARWREALLRTVPGLRLESRFVPHVTLAYGREVLPEAEVVPVHWRVDGLALVQSVVGQHDYRTLASWPLRD